MKKTYKGQISEEDIRNLPLIHFTGELKVIKTVHEVETCLDLLKNQRILGFDTETKPSFKKGKKNRVAILQLSTENQAYIFQLNKIGLHSGLIEILANKTIIKVGAAIKDDILALVKIRQFEPSGFVDIQKIVGEYGIEQISLKKMAAIVLGGRISKSQQTSNWEQDELTEAQQLYAATDAWCSLKIYTTLNHHT
ncbi:MAG: 3'-5' exonuclease domain-containing protein 2 [Bacteroidales bacterium]|nr:3'-5' exonuclease domain-containing protein 2 [Bacteroidales bacterium]